MLVFRFERRFFIPSTESKQILRRSLTYSMSNKSTWYLSFPFHPQYLEHLTSLFTCPICIPHAICFWCRNWNRTFVLVRFHSFIPIPIRLSFIRGRSLRRHLCLTIWMGFLTLSSAVDVGATLSFISLTHSIFMPLAGRRLFVCFRLLYFLLLFFSFIFI